MHTRGGIFGMNIFLLSRKSGLEIQPRCILLIIVLLETVGLVLKKN